MPSPARRSLAAGLAATVALSLSACREPSAPPRVPDLARFHGGDPAVVTLPDTVTAGVPFEVSVRTSTGQCRRPGRTDVQVGGQVAFLTLYPDGDCAPVGPRLAALRVVAVTFAEPGRGAVRVLAEDDVGPQTFERVVVVR